MKKSVVGILVVTMIFIVICALTVTAYLQITSVQDAAHEALTRGEIATEELDSVVRPEIRKILLFVSIVEFSLISGFFLWSLHGMNDLKNIGERDAMTGLYNRVRFRELRQKYVRTPPHRLGIVFFDVDGLKITNDTKGHEEGDFLICTVAKCLRRSFGDRVYRIGGDEFIVIDTEIAEEELKDLLHNAVAMMDEKKVSASYGLVWREGNCDFSEQVDEADEKMYRRKRFKKRLSEDKEV